MLNQTRNEKIIELAKNDTTYEEMGQMFSISRERVRQVLVELAPDLVKERKLNRIKKYTNRCEYCGEVKKHTYSKSSYGIICEECKESIIQGNKERWSRHHDKCSKCGTVDIPHNSHGLCSKCIYKWQYNNLPGRKQRAKEFTERWAKNNPEKIRIIQNRAVKKYHKKLKADPVRYKEYLKRQNDRRKLKMKDPEYGDKMRTYYRERYHKNKVHSRQSPTDVRPE